MISSPNLGMEVQGIYDLDVWINVRHHNLTLACRINFSSIIFLCCFLPWLSFCQDRGWRAKVKMMKKQPSQSLKGLIITVLLSPNKSQPSLISFYYWKTIPELQIRFTGCKSDWVYLQHLKTDPKFPILGMGWWESAWRLILLPCNSRDISAVGSYM